MQKRNIKTIGTATTLDEALKLDEAQVDFIIASGFEAGGHCPSFLNKAEYSLTGTFALIQQLTSRIKTPIIAAGGIVNSNGIIAVLSLGASGVQIGTAFLACDESNANEEYKCVLFSERAKHTSIKTSFTGRLRREISGTISDALSQKTQTFPFPQQTHFIAPLRRVAIGQDKSELITFWVEQIASELKHKNVSSLMAELTS